MSNETLPVPTIPLRFDATTRQYHRMPDASRVYDLIVAAGERQLATTDVGRALISVGLGEQALELIRLTAANAANPIATEIEEAIQSSLS